MLNGGSNVIHGLESLSVRGIYRLLIKGLRVYPSNNRFQIYKETRDLFKQHKVRLNRQSPTKKYWRSK